MDYGTSSTNFNNELNGFRTDILNMNSVSFDGWSGSAKDNYYGSYQTNMSNLETEFNKIGIFTELLAQVEVYKDRKEEIERLQSQLSSLPNTEENASQRASLASTISQLQAENQQLKAALNAAFASFGGVGTKLSLNSSLFDFGTSQNATIQVEFNINELLAKFRSGKLHYLNNGESLYNYYGGNEVGREHVRQVLAKIQSTYTGREAAVNSALALIQLCADAGIKIDYEHKGTMGTQPFVPTDQVATGVDCNPMASWIVDKGTPGGFVWRPVGEFKGVGETCTDWTTAKPGDVLVSDGHVAVIVANDPANNQFITVESSNGVEIKTRSYSAMKGGGYQVRDMTNVYNGTENTYRPIFDQYIGDIKTFNRPF